MVLYRKVGKPAFKSLMVRTAGDTDYKQMFNYNIASGKIRNVDPGMTDSLFDAYGNTNNENWPIVAHHVDTDSPHR
jgi:hypothetical protein